VQARERDLLRYKHPATKPHGFSPLDVLAGVGKRTSQQREIMDNKYLENTHIFQSSLNTSQSIVWYENSTSINLTVRNQNRTSLGGKSTEIRLSPADVRELIVILKTYLVHSGDSDAEHN